jgi:1,4-dihydroxy-2-naphthoate octaprenyltransferase
MENEELKDNDQETVPKSKTSTSTHIVTAESVQAEEVPTIPLGSLETISALQPEVSVHSVASTRSVSMPAPLVVQPSEYRRSPGEWLQIWWDGVRPAYLPLAIMPLLVGSTLAWTQSITPDTPLGQFRLLPFIGAIVVVCLLQFGASLINDYYDYLRGIDTGNPLGPGGLIQQGLIKPTWVLICGMALLALGSLLGLVVAMPGGPQVYLFGLIGVVCAYFFSATSRALSSLALGELIVFIIYGPFITLGAYMIQTGTIARNVPIYSIPLGLMAAAALHINNMRDMEGDSQAGKRTLATLLGLQWSRAWFLVLLLGACAVVVVLGVPPKAPHLILISLWTLPTIVVIATTILRTDAPASFHSALQKMLNLETAFMLLLIAGLIITALFPVLPYIPARILPV